MPAISSSGNLPVLETSAPRQLPHIDRQKYLLNYALSSPFVSTTVPPRDPFNFRTLKIGQLCLTHDCLVEILEGCPMLTGLRLLYKDVVDAPARSFKLHGRLIFLRRRSRLSLDTMSPVLPLLPYISLKPHGVMLPVHLFPESDHPWSGLGTTNGPPSRTGNSTNTRINMGRISFALCKHCICHH